MYPLIIQTIAEDQIRERTERAARARRARQVRAAARQPGRHARTAGRPSFVRALLTAKA